MNLFADTFLLTYGALFPIVNPIGSAPLFLGLTQFCTERERNSLALRVAINSLFLLIGSLFFGSYILEFFGISLPVVRIGGGVVVTAFGWKLLNSDERPDGERDATKNTSPIPDPFYPLTMPLTVGPGSISVAIALGSQRDRDIGVASMMQSSGAAILGIVAVALTVFFCYRFAESTVARLGKTGTNVVVRLSAFIMLCIGIQIIWGGWSALSQSL
ncbi:MAG TPA: MarC family protein [Rhizomicrobium sp.]|jgi:multiple antibiotic resistance protein|nr:MarC family protein [Rhizomicrobium sp.]